MNTVRNVSVILSLILLATLFDISSLYSAWSTLADYDSSKVKVALQSSATYADFQSRLGFITGIGLQMYVYDYFFDWSVGGVKLVCNFIFLLAIVLASLRPPFLSGEQKYNFPISALVCTVLLSLFATNAIVYLKTYGMFIYVEMILMGVVLALVMREAPDALFHSKRSLFYTAVTLSLVMVLFDPRFLPFLWGALSLYLLIWWSFLSNKYKATIITTLLIALVPFTVSLFLTPHILDFRPAHSKPFFFATSGQNDVLLYLKSSMGSLFEMTFQSPLHFAFVLFCCGLSTFVLERRASIVLLGFIIFIPLGAFIASLLDLYPFGHIRYLLPWLGVLLVLVSNGIWGVVKLLSVKAGKWSKVDSLAVISVLAYITVSVANSLPTSFVKVSKAASRSNATKDFYASLENFNEKLSICDAPSAVLLKAQGLNCDLNIGWGYQKKERELPHALNKIIDAVRLAETERDGMKCIFFASFKPPKSEYYLSYLERVASIGFQVDIKNIKHSGPSPYVLESCQ